VAVGLNVLQASTDRDLDTVFATFRADALVIGPYLFFNSREEQLGALSLRHAVPAIFIYRQFVAAGGLMSYGANEAEVTVWSASTPEKLSQERSRVICRSKGRPR
jgi:putative ABC transport system substrate-binding protein